MYTNSVFIPLTDKVSVVAEIPEESVDRRNGCLKASLETLRGERIKPEFWKEARDMAEKL